ncbi:hypothetical protein CRU99_03650 [Malaciobacter mytili]|uniref:hypothetical protein n=1 Tax=Malaciobacter mytili TaxID=603050 RepID=UPI00100BD222|nr:hypothetical protein [Malaciobacter mytili]RXI45403.1 hypothetical protein CRU99_03650 [Malaciobacter mytili]
MGFFYLFPILIYFSIVNFFINRYLKKEEESLYKNKKEYFEKRKFEKENEKDLKFKKEKRILKIKKVTLFILFSSIPFWDGIVYSLCMKYVLFTNQEIIINKKVTNLEEQKNYWFWQNFINEKNILIENFLGNSLGKERLVKIDFLRKEDEINDIRLKDTALEVHLFVFNETKTIKKYLNYCKKDYNNLDKNDKKYKYSCIYTDEIIKKYNLKNVIKVPQTPYIKSTKKEYIFKPFNFYKTIEYIQNKNTNEIYGEKIVKYSIQRGWYVSFWSDTYITKNITYEQYINSSKNLESIIIPNPFKKEI